MLPKKGYINHLLINFKLGKFTSLVIESRFVRVNINRGINLFVSLLPFLVADVDVGA